MRQSYGRWQRWTHLFQSTHPRGVRHEFQTKGQELIKISIHAPARGATKQQVYFDNSQTDFNPRTREGCDLTLSSYRKLYIYFNPRTREGCDLTLSSYRKLYIYFNPRTREGCDDILSNLYVLAKGFQSTHPRGVRQKLSLLYLHLEKFQSTHPRGVRRKIPKIVLLTSDISIHAPARGATKKRKN